MEEAQQLAPPGGYHGPGAAAVEQRHSPVGDVVDRQRGGTRHSIAASGLSTWSRTMRVSITSGQRVRTSILPPAAYRSPASEVPKASTACFVAA